MATPGWLNQNSGRNFPFVEDVSLTLDLYENSACCTDETADLPKETILDLRIRMKPDSRFNPTDDRVYLRAICRDDDTIYFEFAATSPYLSTYPLVFMRSISDQEFTTTFVESTPDRFERPCVSSGYNSGWEGWLTTGDLSSLLEILTESGMAMVGSEEVVVEPALVESVSPAAYVRSISTAHYHRIADLDFYRPTDCGSDATPSSVTNSRIAGLTCLTSDYVFYPGANMEILQSESDNSITFVPTKGGGEGEPCGDPYEDPESEFSGINWSDVSDDLLNQLGAYREVFDSGFACNQTIRNFCGVYGPEVGIVAGPGIRIEAGATSVDGKGIGVNIVLDAADVAGGCS